MQKKHRWSEINYLAAVKFGIPEIVSNLVRLTDLNNRASNKEAYIISGILMADDELAALETLVLDVDNDSIDVDAVYVCNALYSAAEWRLWLTRYARERSLAH